MSKLSVSPDRHVFTKQNYLMKILQEGKSMKDPDVVAELKVFAEADQLDISRATDIKWQTNNLEYDLRTTKWILKRVRESKVYAQHLYAALCNNDFCRDNIVVALQEKYWSCSWRYAGEIIANMRESGDYIDWYCSGSREIKYVDNGTIVNEKPEYLVEGIVSSEIHDDLKHLGWVVVKSDKLGQIQLDK